MSSPKAREDRSERDGSIVVLHLAFGLLGMATALPGAVLPILAAHWSLHDSGAGLLFAAQFTGGATGGLLTRKRFFATSAIGFCLLTVSAASVGLAGPTAAIPLMFFYGLGQGAATTSISMMVGRRYAERRGSVLSLLNFFWSVGAAICPLLMARLLEKWQIGLAFQAMALMLGIVLVLLVAFSRSAPPAVIRGSGQAAKAAPALVAFFALLAFLYVGVESTIGGWISTFAERTAMLDARHATAMASCFWGALLAGRGLSSVVLLRVRERVLYVGCLIAGILGIALLLGAHSAVAVGLGAVVTGLSLAPIFPVNLSLFLSRAGEFSRAGIMLAISGFGGAVLPWLTGLISNHTGSLRTALTVPMAAILIMFAMALAACVGSKPLFVDNR
jgi:MFS transporter, FHS family, glucose/mannose:H+ symporter